LCGWYFSTPQNSQLADLVQVRNFQSLVGDSLADSFNLVTDLQLMLGMSSRTDRNPKIATLVELTLNPQ